MRLLKYAHQLCQRRQSPVNNWIIRRVSKKLQLNETQKVKLSLLQDVIVSSRSYVTDVHKDRSLILDDIFKDNGFDRESALHYLNVPRLAFEEQAPAIVDALGEFYQCLNEQQQEQFRSMLLQHRQQQTRCWH